MRPTQTRLFEKQKQLKRLTNFPSGEIAKYRKEIQILQQEVSYLQEKYMREIVRSVDNMRNSNK